MDKRTRQIVESFGSAHETQIEVERRLNQLPADMIEPVETALVVLQGMHRNGPSWEEWKQACRAHMQLDDDQIEEVMNLTVKTFLGLVIRKVGDHIGGGSFYAWYEAPTTAAPEQEEEIEVDPMIRAAVGGQINITYQALAWMKEKVHFTFEEFLDFLRSIVPGPMAQHYADHCLNLAFRGIEKNGNIYTYREPATKTADENLSFLKSLGPLKDDSDTTRY